MALSLSPPTKSRDHHQRGGSPSPSTKSHDRRRRVSPTPSTGQRHRSPSPRPGHYHYPYPNSTNYPTSPYHRPPSPKYPSSPKHSPSHSRSAKSAVRLSPYPPSSPEHIPAHSFKFPAVPMSKSLQCVLCLKEYQDARMLPCFHTFCAACLEHSCLERGEKRGGGGGNQLDSVYCPICIETTELSSKGVQGLPQNVYVERLRDLQCSPTPKLTCDLCVGSDVAVKYCENCDCNLCEFCGHAHQKQRKTSLHQLANLELEARPVAEGEAGGVSRVPARERNKIVYCKVHIQQQLKLFCKTCDTPMCTECVSLGGHQNHTLLPLKEASAQHLEVLQNLVSQADPMVTSLAESVKNIEFIQSSIQERSEAVSEEIIASVSSHMRALQEHKRLLLLQLDAEKKQKENTLKVQATYLREVLAGLSHSCDEAKIAIEDGIPSVAFMSTRSPVASRLEELVCTKLDMSPKEDDYIHFHSRVPVEEQNGFHMYGVLDCKGPSAANTTAEGEGLYSATEGKTSQFKVLVYDRYKQHRKVGGDRVEASMISVGKGEVVHMFISDGENGSYVVSYTPESRGEHALSVLVGGKHIRGSPFAVSVLCRQSGRHCGTFHCCTFCSSRGKKHTRCGCGGTMPGGYSGCGHGHPGHPGRKHWSCCGSTTKNSDCLL